MSLTSAIIIVVTVTTVGLIVLVPIFSQYVKSANAPDEPFHERHPIILDWHKGDHIRQAFENTSNGKFLGYYEGITDNYDIVLSGSSGNFRKIPVAAFVGLINEEAVSRKQRREVAVENKATAMALENSQYDIFLKLQSESQNELHQKMLKDV
jgi:hypothetical protein